MLLTDASTTSTSCSVARRDKTAADYMFTKANVGGFRFHGAAAHASRSPELGRSALDAVD